MAYIGKTPTVGNFQKCDAISVVNGQAAYTLQVGGSNVSPESPNHVLVSLNGVLQAPTDSYTISGSTLTFASNLATGDVIDFVMLLGNVLDLGTPSDNTVTAAKLNNDIISGQTELASAPEDTDELLISDGGTLKRIDVSLIGGDNTPSFFVTLSGNQSIANETWTKITFDTETWDTDSAFASNKFTVPSGEAGKYYIAAKTALENIDDNELTAISIYKNGSQIGTTQFEARSPGTNKTQFLVVNTILDLSASDYLEVYVTHAEGGSVNALSSRSYFGGYKLIGV